MIVLCFQGYVLSWFIICEKNITTWVLHFNRHFYKPLCTNVNFLKPSITQSLQCKHQHWNRSRKNHFFQAIRTAKQRYIILLRLIICLFSQLRKSCCLFCKDHEILEDIFATLQLNVEQINEIDDLQVDTTKLKEINELSNRNFIISTVFHSLSIVCQILEWNKIAKKMN